MNANEPVAYIDPYDLERLPHYDCYIGSQQLKNGIPLYTNPVKEHFEDEPQAEELHEIMQSNTHPVKEQDESFDRTASHMAGEYVSHPVKELKNIVLASATCSCGKIMEVTNLQPVKDLEDIDINITWNENSMRDFGKDELAFARAILRRAQE